MRIYDSIPSLIAQPAHSYDASCAADWRDRAQKLHETFVTELVEAYDFCPWAKSARAAQRSKIVALFEQELHLFCDHLIAQPAYHTIEVWQLVIPDVSLSAMKWRAYVADLEQNLRRDGNALPWALAAFHPEHPGRPESIGGVIGMLRRSPLPAIQLVRLDVLDRVRAKAADRVHALPIQNQRTLQQWLQDQTQRKKHARWLKEGQKLQREIVAKSP